MNRCRLRIAKLRPSSRVAATTGNEAGATPRATCQALRARRARWRARRRRPAPARRCPRASASSAARGAATSADQNSSDRRLPPQRRQRSRLCRRGPEREVRRRERLVEPGAACRRGTRRGVRPRRRRPLAGADAARAARSRIVPPSTSCGTRAFSGTSVKPASCPTARRPSASRRAGSAPRPNEQLLRVLRQEPGAGLHDLCPRAADRSRR